MAAPEEEEEGRGQRVRGRVTQLSMLMAAPTATIVPPGPTKMPVVVVVVVLAAMVTAMVATMTCAGRWRFLWSTKDASTTG